MTKRDFFRALILKAPPPPPNYAPKMQLKFTYPKGSDFLTGDFVERQDVMEQLQRFIDSRITLAQQNGQMWPDVRAAWRPLLPSEPKNTDAAAAMFAKNSSAWHENVMKERSEYEILVLTQWAQDYARRVVGDLNIEDYEGGE